MTVSGDKETNRYTDAVVAEIKSKLNVDFDYSIFGGSNYADFFTEVKKADALRPIIRIDTVANFTFECTAFLLKRPNGAVEKLDHDFVHMLPYVYGISMRVYHDDASGDTAGIIEKQIRSLYSGEVEVWVEVPGFRGNKSLVKLFVAPDQEPTEPAQEHGLSVKIIPFIPYYSVYYFQGWDPAALSSDLKQQFTVLQIAEFSCLTYSKYEDALTYLEKDYLTFINHEKNRWRSFFSPAYKQVKDRYDRGLPIDQDTFNSAFRKIVCVVPQLFKFFINGATYDDIHGIIAARAGEINQRYVEACDDLKLPEQINGKYGVVFNCRESRSLTSLLEAVAGKNVSLETAVKNQLRTMEIRKRDELFEAYDRANYEGEQIEYESDGSSGHGSFLRDVVSTAAGVYIGERLADRKRAKREAELEESRREWEMKQESERRHQAALESQRQWEAVRRANEERRKKGQPELPLPPRSWY